MRGRGSGCRQGGLCALVALAVLSGGCAGPWVRDEPAAPATDERPLTAPAPQPAGAAAPAATPPSAARPPETAPAPPADVWARIRAGLSLARPHHPRVARELDWLVANPEFLERTAVRAQPMLHYIVEQVEQRGLPLELALLPVVESAFQVKAYSPRHASGVWQFIASTGRRYGLEQNAWYDGRRDIVESTRAALDFLETLYRRFGDWELALAAYNCGERTVERAAARNRLHGRAVDFWSLQLPAETRVYLPRLLAVAEAVSAPQRYGQRLAPIPDQPYFTVLDAADTVGLRDAAQAAGVEHELFAELNPGYLRGVTDPGGRHRLLVPIEHAPRLRNALPQLPRRQRPSLHRHRIASGETLGHIAARYGTSVAALQRANGLRGSLIRAGRDLLVPGAADPGPHAGGAAAAGRVHTVRRGDSLWKISRRYGVTVDELVRWNDVGRATVLSLGQRLIVSAAQPPLLHAAALDLDTSGTTLRYRVRRGDSLWKIAREFGVRVEDLRRWNRLPSRSVLHPGQELEVRTAHASGVRI